MDIQSMFNYLKLPEKIQSLIKHKIKQHIFCKKNYIHLSFISYKKKINNVYFNIPLYYKLPCTHSKRTIHAEENAIRNFFFKNKKEKCTIYSLRLNFNKNGKIFSRLAKPCKSCYKLIKKYKEYIKTIIYSSQNGFQIINL